MGDKKVPGDQSNWSWVKEGDLECLPPQKLHDQEFLGEGEMLLVKARAGDGLLPDDPKTSPMQNAEWIKWHTQQVDMLTWWQGLKEVPGQDNLQEFAQRVWASLKLPKTWSCNTQVDNDHSALPAHHFLDRDWFLPVLEMWFSSQDFWLTQPQKTLAYAKALQYWAEKAQLPIPGEPCHLAESVLELWWMMEPLTTFMDQEVLGDTPPSNWVKIMPSRLAEEPTQWEHNHSRTCQANSRGSFLAANGGRWPGPQTTAIAQMTAQATQSWEVMPWQAESNSQTPTPPPGFVEIALSLHGDNAPKIVTGIPPEEVKDQDHI